ncbi:MAG: hypothetical protein IJW01_07770 [Paludibacteraceae bacterium]|nr:hypothetical protein [Paludibacteraceae bacterium]
MRQYIHVTKETREFLSKAFDIEPRTVYNALNFVKDNDLAKRIRKLAYEKGGILMCLCECMETLHDNDGYVRQYLPNGVMLELNKKNGRVDIIKDGKSVKNYQHVMLDRLPAIQAEAQTI